MEIKFIFACFKRENRIITTSVSFMFTLDFLQIKKHNCYFRVGKKFQRAVRKSSFYVRKLIKQDSLIVSNVQ